MEDLVLFGDSELRPNAGRSTLGRWKKRPHVTLGTVLLNNRPAFREFGLRDPNAQKLGRGAFGVAYEIKVGERKSVLKLTRDPYEATAAVMLLGKKLAHVVPIHGVWAVAGTTQRGYAAWFVIHRGLLSPLNKRDEKLVDIIADITDPDSDMGDALDLAFPTPMQHKLRSKWTNVLRAVLEEESMRGDLQRASKLVDDIGAGVHELGRAGIEWDDVHSSNIMRDPDNSRLTIADIGWGITYNDVDAVWDWFNEDEVKKHIAVFRG